MEFWVRETGKHDGVTIDSACVSSERASCILMEETYIDITDD